MSLLAGPPDSTGGCQGALVDKLGVSPSRYHHVCMYVFIYCKWTQVRWQNYLDINEIMKYKSNKHHQ
jgi:hypothetical protein